MEQTRGIDWHVHTWEGSLESKPVEQVVNEAIDAKLDAVAITDHHSVNAIDKAVEVAQGRVEIVPGMELDARYGNKIVHIVGYFPKSRGPRFKKDLQEISKERRIRMFEMAGRLVLDRIIPAEDFAEIIDQLEEKQLYSSKALMVELIDRYKGTQTEFGEKLALLEARNDYRSPKGQKKEDLLSRVKYEFFSKGKPWYAPYHKEDTPTVKEVVNFCRRYGAPCGFAHIKKDLRRREVMTQAIQEGIEAGMVLIGIGHPKHSERDERFLRRESKDLTTVYRGKVTPIILTNGTDYHGKPNYPGVGGIRSGIETLDHMKWLIR